MFSARCERHFSSPAAEAAKAELMAGDNNSALFTLACADARFGGRGWYIFSFRRACAGHVGSSREELLAIFFFCWNACITALHLYIYIILHAVYGNDHLHMYIKKGVGCLL
uniref:Uncharacterized protein n=1 Tax=Rhipicephalus zambeziensis TaxID=60191 RepID=A0A224YCV7_9ACAR